MEVRAERDKEARAERLKELKPLRRRKGFYEWVGAAMVGAASVALILEGGLGFHIGFLGLGLWLSIMGAVYSLQIAAVERNIWAWARPLWVNDILDASTDIEYRLRAVERRRDEGI